MLIYAGDPYNKLITASRGTGDNLTTEDIKNGFVDYYMTSLYELDGEDIKLKDGGQLLMGKKIEDLELDEEARALMSYWFNDAPEDYVLLESY